AAAIDVKTAAVVGGIGLVAGVIGVVVLIVVRRRLAWLVYLGAVLLWIVVLQVLKPWWAPDMTMLNLDVALTLLLTIAAVLLARGVQRDIDAFEITVTMAVTFLVIELPLISGLMPLPETITLWVAVTA